MWRPTANPSAAPLEIEAFGMAELASIRAAPHCRLRRGRPTRRGEPGFAARQHKPSGSWLSHFAQSESRLGASTGKCLVFGDSPVNQAERLQAKAKYRWPFHRASIRFRAGESPPPDHRATVPALRAGSTPAF